MNAATIEQKLSGLPVPQVRYFESTGSTNDIALAWVSDGAQDGCLVVANRQTRGKGRLGRRWITQPNTSLAFSLVLHPTRAEQDLTGRFSPLGALAVCQALEKGPGLTPQIKWPNDILLNRKKTAGILVEMSWLGDQLQGLVVGIGINITSDSVPPADELTFPATCIEEVASKQINRLDLLHDCLNELFAWRAKINEPSFLSAWNDRLAFKGEMVSIQEGTSLSSTLIGELIGLDSSGNLTLRIQNGDLAPVTAGDVHLRLIDS